MVWVISSFIQTLVLIAENENNLQKLVFEFNTACTLYNMELSTKKTKMMTIMAGPVWYKIVVEVK